MRLFFLAWCLTVSSLYNSAAAMREEKLNSDWDSAARFVFLTSHFSCLHLTQNFGIRTILKLAENNAKLLYWRKQFHSVVFFSLFLLKQYLWKHSQRCGLSGNKRRNQRTEFSQGAQSIAGEGELEDLCDSSNFSDAGVHPEQSDMEVAADLGKNSNNLVCNELVSLPSTNLLPLTCLLSVPGKI